MSWSYEEIRNELLETISNLDPVDEAETYADCLDKLEKINKAEAAEKETPEVPPTGVKAWFDRHSDAFIRVGGTVVAIGAVAFAESKFDLIFKSKASRFI